MATRKTRRIQMLIFGAVLLAGAAGLVSFAFRDTIVFFFSPTELMAEGRSPDQLLRVGGLVAEGSLRRGEGETVSFDVTDGNGTLTVAYTGVLPDLFREGQGVVAEGYLRGGRFEAVEVLAKHDENYMPKEVADALKEQGHWQDGEPAAGAAGGSGS
ncbi:cytochrome c maturation protein CcmE [Limibaculum sp. FT325]|uniref:cytochrome c maturation protein CcmE n=1 Tax=Thermohalobaculum sediminis TaxID=2939436 RepID=UPI0020BE20DB|nr:cytochrome c maturation protein CcmE [Limibaculum sediminis]MCL5777283.1 cytochrome c maturation protein CcmE [Limibaculum sediminis]